ncbi:hypothetical protein LT193_002833, partial [Enterococcus faecalis]|nr:hypothetical protein [Enterococcus faecalis]
MMNCNEIEEVIKELLPLLKKYNTGDMSYYIDQLSTALDILNSNISITEKNQELYKIGKKLFPARGGLTDFNVWVEDGEERISINKPIDDLTD